MAADPPNLAEVRLRAEIEDEVRADFAAVERLEHEANLDRRLFGLAVAVTLAVTIVLPLLGAVIGLSVRVFRLASGF